MKKIIFVAILVLGLTACGAPLFMTANDIARRAQIGMTIEEFEKLAGMNARLYERTLHGVTFGVDTWAGPEDHRYISETKLFFFNSESRLVSIETRRMPPPMYGPALIR